MHCIRRPVSDEFIQPSCLSFTSFFRPGIYCAWSVGFWEQSSVQGGGKSGCVSLARGSIWAWEGGLGGGNLAIPGDIGLQYIYHTSSVLVSSGRQDRTSLRTDAGQTGGRATGDDATSGRRTRRRGRSPFVRPPGSIPAQIPGRQPPERRDNVVDVVSCACLRRRERSKSTETETEVGPSDGLRVRAVKRAWVLPRRGQSDGHPWRRRSAKWASPLGPPTSPRVWPLEERTHQRWPTRRAAHRRRAEAAAARGRQQRRRDGRYYFRSRRRRRRRVLAWWRQRGRSSTWPRRVLCRVVRSERALGYGWCCTYATVSRCYRCRRIPCSLSAARPAGRQATPGRPSAVNRCCCSYCWWLPWRSFSRASRGDDASRRCRSRRVLPGRRSASAPETHFGWSQWCCCWTMPRRSRPPPRENASFPQLHRQPGETSLPLPPEASGAFLRPPSSPDILWGPVCESPLPVFYLASPGRRGRGGPLGDDGWRCFGVFHSLAPSRLVTRPLDHSGPFKPSTARENGRTEDQHVHTAPFYWNLCQIRSRTHALW